MLTAPNTWVWVAVYFIYGVIFFGPSASVLGGIGWFVVSATLLPLRVSNVSFLLLGTLSGDLVGACFEVIYRFAVDIPAQNFAAEWTWIGGSVAGDAAGGFIVAYYAATVPSNGGDKASIIGNPHAPG
jgi:hypothetical protein